MDDMTLDLTPRGTASIEAARQRSDSDQQLRRDFE